MAKPRFCSEQGQVAGHLEYFVELTGAVQCREYLDQLGN